MRKAISSLLCSAMIAAAALPVFAGDISATGQFQSTYTNPSGKDATLNSTFQLDLKGAMTDTFDINARLLFTRKLTLDDPHIITVPNFDTIAFDNYRITHHNNIKIGSDELKYSVDFTKSIDVPTSADPMTIIYEKGAGNDVVELQGEYKNYKARLGIMGGVAGRWYGQALADEVLPGLQLGALTYNEYLPGINPEDDSTYNKAVFAGYINSVFGTYKPTDNFLKGLELNAGYYATRQPDSAARPTGPVLETDRFEFNADQLAAQGMRNVIGKGYRIVIRGEFTRQPGTDRWCPGDGNWDKQQTEDIVLDEIDGKVVVLGRTLLEVARKNGREADLSRDNSRYGGIKLVAFDTNGNRIMTDGQFPNNTQLSTLLTDPTKGKVNGNAAVILARYERGPLAITLDAKRTNNNFNATTTNFYKKNDYSVLNDDRHERGETKIPVLTTDIRLSDGALRTTNYDTYDATYGFVKFAPTVEYQMNDAVKLTLDTQYKKAERFMTAVTSGDNPTRAQNPTYYYYMARPKVEVDLDGRYVVEAYGEAEKLMTKESRYFAEGNVMSYNVTAEANDVIPYVQKLYARARYHKLDNGTGALGQKDQNKSRYELTIDSIDYKNFKYFGSYRLDGQAYNNTTDPATVDSAPGEIRGKRSIIFNQLKYTGASELDIRLGHKYVYDRDKTGSQWNLLIGEANYKFQNTPYSLANDVQVKVLGKYNFDEENDGTNKASMFFSVKKTFASVNTLELKYGSDADFYEHDKNETQKKETTLEFISRF